MKKLSTIATIIIIFIMVVVNFAILYLMIDIKINLNNDIGNTVNKSVDNLHVTDSIKTEVTKALGEAKIGNMVDKSVKEKVDSLNIHNGYNGKDGIDGQNGVNSTSTNTTIIEKTIEQVPVNGLTPMPRCNKSRWEISYNNGISWEISFDENNKPVKCSI